MATITTTPNSTLPSHLRPFDARRDLSVVADLIEACFDSTLDPDGRRYLRNMRSAAGSKGLDRWAAMASGNPSLPLAGFVWEENGRVVGNLSMIPFFSQGRRIYLIANVAVYPEYRRRGVARALTEAALEKSQQRRVNQVWLQAREDNPAALGLYASMGFVQRASRTTWNSNPVSLMGEAPAGVRVTQRAPRHWQKQQSWLDELYPLELRWNFPLRIRSFQPGFWSLLHRFFNEVDIRHWAAQRGKDLLGLLTWQASRGYADRLWLAAPPENDDLAVQALSAFIRREWRSRRPLTLDYPAGRANDALTAAGFQPQHTLIWMETKGNG
jgi:ribosomal protein S18 acetylase RimI-like enzyme